MLSDFVGQQAQNYWVVLSPGEQQDPTLRGENKFNHLISIGFYVFMFVSVS